MKEPLDLSAEAAALDTLAEADDSAGAVDAAIGATKPDTTAAPAAKPKKSHHKKKGRPSKNPSDDAMRNPAKKPVPGGAETSPGSTTGVDEIPDEFLKQAIATAANSGLQMLKRSGWTSPATKMMSEEEFCHAAAHCIDAIRVKYMGNSLDEYGAEVALVLLVAPWTLQNIMRILDARRKGSRVAGLDGIRKDVQAGGAHPGGAAGNPGGSDDGLEKLSELGNIGANDPGSGTTQQAA